MKMNVSRFAEIADGPDSKYLSDVSMRFANLFSQAMQMLGVCGVRVERSRTVPGNMFRLADVAMFDGVPEGCSRYSRGIMEASAQSLASFGISEIRIMADPQDMDALRGMWSQMLEPGDGDGPVEVSL